MSVFPVVAVVGAPNVGKSSFINRVTGSRTSVVADEPGTTRDRAYKEAEWAGRDFVLVDTGGMEPTASSGLKALVTLQARVAVAEADVVLHIADSRLGVTEADTTIARELLSSGAKVLLAVNKLDNHADDTERYVFYSLGEGEPHAISTLHGIGIGDLLDEVVGLLPDSEAVESEQYPTIAIVGRPNAGKSTLMNRLAGLERAVVSEVPGTTTDSVEHLVEIESGGVVGRYALLDTAGVNRSSRRAEGVPFYSSLRTSAAIRRADVSLLMVDAVEGLTGGDLKIAREIEENGRSCGVIINKTDLVDSDRVREIEAGVAYRMSDLEPPFMGISALTGRGADEVVPFAAEIHRAFGLRLPTHEVAEFINEIVGRSSPAKGVKIRYGTQTGTRPPRFTVFANRPKDVQDNYLRYIQNSFRRKYGLYGVTVEIKAKASHRNSGR